MSFQLGSLNKQFNTETESFQRSFNLTHKGDPIFSHEFDGASSTNVLLGSNTFVIKNHFWRKSFTLNRTYRSNNFGNYRNNCWYTTNYSIKQN